MELPDKMYYSISEIAEYTGIEPHVLRYWESEFPTLKPKRSRSGTRTYQKKDIEEISAIRRLLHEQGYKIEGARKMRRREISELRSDDSIQVKKQTAASDNTQIKQKLADILKLVQELGADESGNDK
ncbi:MerR family transcriptional regulator [bacterium]|jgi:DNA-binding transcriptional MerR regulator|nr:MerR family transcriptional regulator [bacterium]MBT7310159.1 MerR family transcriptional regulator [bacterium]